MENHALLPDDLPALNEAVEEKNRAVKKRLRFRMSRTTAAVMALLAVLLMIVGLVPGFLRRTEIGPLSLIPKDLFGTVSGWLSFLPAGVKQGLDSLLEPLLTADGAADKRLLIIMAVFAIIVIVIAVYVILVWHKNQLYDEVGSFRQTCQETVSELTRNAESYSDFLSDVATHTNGSSYLNALDNQRRKLDSSYYFSRTQIKAIDLLTEKILQWSNALHTEIDVSSQERAEFIEDMPDITDFDSLYTLESEKIRMVELNRMGVYVESPFEFVNKLVIVREEVYDRAVAG